VGELGVDGGVLREEEPHGPAVGEDEAGAAAALGEEAGRHGGGDDGLVVVVVDAADEGVGGQGGEVGVPDVARRGVVVDEEPPGLDGDEDIFGEVAEGEEVVWLETGGAEDGVELGSEGEVGAREVGDGDVEAVRRRVGAEVGEEDGRAEGVEIWNRCGLAVDGSVGKEGALAYLRTHSQ
jgi:hypothetical protein